MATKMEEKILEAMDLYVNAFEKYILSGKCEEKDLNIMAGALEYIINPEDFVPDDIPNVGLLDDILVVLEAADNLVFDRKLDISKDEHKKMVEEFNSKKGMLFNIPDSVSVDALERRGISILKKNSVEELIKSVKKELSS